MRDDFIKGWHHLFCFIQKRQSADFWNKRSWKRLVAHYACFSVVKGLSFSNSYQVVWRQMFKKLVSTDLSVNGAEKHI